MAPRPLHFKNREAYRKYNAYRYIHVEQTPHHHVNRPVLINGRLIKVRHGIGTRHPPGCQLWTARRTEEAPAKLHVPIPRGTSMISLQRFVEWFESIAKRSSHWLLKKKGHKWCPDCGEDL